MYRLVADLFRQLDGEKPGLDVKCNLAAETEKKTEIISSE